MSNIQRPRVRIVRGDLERFPAKVYVVSSSGAVSGGVALKVANAFGATEKIQALPRVKAGAGRVVAVGKRFIAHASTGESHENAADTAVRRALSSTFKAIGEQVKDGVVAMPAIGTRGANYSARDFADALTAALPELPGACELCILVPDASRHRELLERFRDHLLQLESDADDHARRLAKDTGFLFVGSGLSFNAEPPLPSWVNLFPATRAPKGKVATDFLPEAAQVWADATSPQQVHDEMLQVIEKAQLGARPSLLHFQLLSLPWRAIITTNWDTLLEDTLDAMGLPHCVVRSDAELAATRGDSRLKVIKLHGGLAPKTKHDAPGGSNKELEHRALVATRDEYDAFFDDRPGLAAYLESHVITGHGLIVGHSMQDAHFRALFARIGRLHDSETREVGVLALSFEDIDPVLNNYWKKRGIQWLRTPDALSLRNFIDGLTGAVHLRRPAFPPDFPSEDAWESLLASLDGRAAARLIATMVDAGARRPSVERLKKLDADAVLALIGHHLTPEERSKLMPTSGPQKDA